MSAQHTPGPWTCDLKGDGLGPVIWAGETRIAHACWWPKDKEQEKANARLIAAAPEMLEALRDVLAAERFSNRPPETVMQAEEKLSRIRAASAKAHLAIAKATGGEE